MVWLDHETWRWTRQGLYLAVITKIKYDTRGLSMVARAGGGAVRESVTEFDA